MSSVKTTTMKQIEEREAFFLKVAEQGSVSRVPLVSRALITWKAAKSNRYFGNNDSITSVRKHIRKNPYGDYTLTQRIKNGFLSFNGIKCFHLLRFHYLLNSLPVRGRSHANAFGTGGLYYGERELVMFTDDSLGSNCSRGKYKIDDTIYADGYKALSRVLVLYKKRGYTVDAYVELLRSLHRLDSMRPVPAFSLDLQSYSLNLLRKYSDALVSGLGNRDDSDYVSAKDFSQLPLEWKWDLLGFEPFDHDKQGCSNAGLNVECVKCLRDKGVSL